MDSPIVNITIPVFNRYLLTQKTILSLRKTQKSISYVVTVVDNGSDDELRKSLVEFKDAGLIDNLFLLPRNMGISCACNVGWRAVDAPYYLKLDNDMAVRRPDWLERLFSLWSHGNALSTLGPTFDKLEVVKNPGVISSEDGNLGICTSNLMGSAIFVPKTVSDILGYWNEDYGLYGAEDGDYGLRMQAAGLTQYYYDANSYFENGGQYDNSEYEGTGLDKGKEHANLFKDRSGGIGLFVLNNYLYSMCIRNWKVPLRYRVKNTERCNVVVEEDPAYHTVYSALRRSKDLLDNLYRSGRIDDIYTDTVVAHLKRIWAGCGQECSI